MLTEQGWAYEADTAHRSQSICLNFPFVDAVAKAMATEEDSYHLMSNRVSSSATAMATGSSSCCYPASGPGKLLFCQECSHRFYFERQERIAS